MPVTHFGIDFGSKMAGTTAVCFEEGGRIQILQSAKNQNADQFILDLAANFQPELVFIDAPLSLPARLINPQAKGDHFYRECDRLLGAMSPMFLGGLTARAIKLKDELKGHGIECIETYPAAFVSTVMEIEEAYKNDIVGFAKALTPFFSSQPLPSMQNWHQTDALLAWISGLRYLEKRSLSFGFPIEGVIII